MSLSSAINSSFRTNTLNSECSSLFICMNEGRIASFSFAARRRLATVRRTRQGALLLSVSSLKILLGHSPEVGSAHSHALHVFDPHLLDVHNLWGSRSNLCQILRATDLGLITIEILLVFELKLIPRHLLFCVVLVLQNPPLKSMTLKCREQFVPARHTSGAQSWQWQHTLQQPEHQV